MKEVSRKNYRFKEFTPFCRRSSRRFAPGRVRGILILVAILFGCRVAVCAAANNVALFGPDQPMAPIIIDRAIDLPDMDARQRRALSSDAREERQRESLRAQTLDDLAYHLERMTGQRPETVIIEDPAAIPSPAIVLGELAHQLGAEPQYETVMRESFRLRVHDGRVLIGGESVYGVSHGIYELLRELGCDWIFPGPEGEIIPARDTVTLSVMDRAKKPVFEIRSPWYSGTVRNQTPEEAREFDQWKVRQQATQFRNRSHPDFLGGGHFWHSLIHHNRELLEENPEMRALVRRPDGTLERGWAQLEPTHPKVIDLTVRSIRGMFERNDWPNDHAVSISISPNDGLGYSVSPEAMAKGAGRMDPITGDHDQTDILIWYANTVLEELEDEFPNLRLGWLLYGSHGDYPMRYTPHPRFTMNIADITQSRYHSLLDPGSATRTYYRNVLDQWGELHRRQGNVYSYYGYNWSLAENLTPYSKMKIWGQDLPYYHRMGVMGYNTEWFKAWSILGPHNYLQLRMGWDIDLDWREVLTHYCQLAFGPAAPHMEAYYLLLIETQHAAGHEAGSHHAVDLIFDADFVSQARSLIRRAERAAESDFHRKMVYYFGSPLTMLEYFHAYRQAARDFDFVTAMENVEAMFAHFDEVHEKNSQMVCRSGRMYLDRLQRPAVEQGKKYSTGDYRIVYPFPDALPTIMDPDAMGQFMGLYHPERRDDNLMTTRTYSTTWDAQGLGPYRRGAVWYRIRFHLETEPAGWWRRVFRREPAAAGTDEEQGIGLFIGAAEDEVHVWFNGEYLGSGHGFPRPFVFDLTDHARPGEENLIALQVIRRSMVNEVWLGGLIYPSFVFAGPRLEQVAPRKEPLQRVLPGGGWEDVTN